MDEGVVGRKLCGYLFERLALAIDEDDLRAFGRETARHRFADAGCRARDDDDLAFEPLAHWGHSCLVSVTTICGNLSGGAPLSSLRGLFGRLRPFSRGTLGRCSAAQTAAFLRRRMVFFGPAAGAALLPAVRFLVHGRPSAPFGLLLRNAAVFVAFLDVLGLALLLAGVTGFVAAGHGVLHRLEIFG
jgi:hypothetical protein